MEERGYGILDFESIWEMARDLIYDVFMDGYLLDEEGNYVADERNFDGWKEKRNTDLRFKYLNFRECKELRTITLASAGDLHCKEIKEKYLFETLPLVRTVMKKGSLTPNEYVKADVPDDYLDQVICAAWKADLMIWASSWDRERKETKE